MRINKQLKNEISALDSLQLLVESYQEIAAIRMRKVRNNVLQNREFLEGLNDMYGNISNVYRQELSILNKKKRSKEKFIVRQTNGKSVLVYLSANTGLYGNIIYQVFNEFLADVKSSDADIVIVGRYGRKMFEDLGLGKKFTYFDFSDSGSDEENTKKVLEYVLPYQSIIVYHGFFQNVLTQISKKTPVTGIDLSNKEDEKVGQERIRYIFEPTIEEVLNFFEKEILTAIFGQSVFEASLSKFASRMISLDYANQNVKTKMKDSHFKVRKLTHKNSNSQQLNLLSSISLWGN